MANKRCDRSLHTAARVDGVSVGASTVRPCPQSVGQSVAVLEQAHVDRNGDSGHR